MKRQALALEIRPARNISSQLIQRFLQFTWLILEQDEIVGIEQIFFLRVSVPDSLVT